jgi:predicted GIY-YIG superfamily endonuclease
MAFYAYILRCADGSTYTGHTDDLERRIGEHHAGRVPGYTHRRRPVRLAWSQEFATREEALSAERRIKGWTRAKKEALIAGDFVRLAGLSISPSRRAYREARGLGLPHGPRAED